jgi:hypothetical protein
LVIQNDELSQKEGFKTFAKDEARCILTKANPTIDEKIKNDINLTMKKSIFLSLEILQILMKCYQYLSSNCEGERSSRRFYS